MRFVSKYSKLYLFRNLTILALSIIFTLIAIEIGLRFIYPDKMHLSYRDHSHPDVPQMNEGTFKHQKLNVHASFDDRGFRINPYKCEEDENLTKVLVVGDSNVAALFLEDQNSLGA